MTDRIPSAIKPVEAAPASVSRWFRDREGRHTCRITRKPCDQAFRCQYSVPEWQGHGGRNRTRYDDTASARHDACDYAVRARLHHRNACYTCPRREKCPETWVCWFYKHFKSTETRP